MTTLQIQTTTMFKVTNPHLMLSMHMIALLLYFSHHRWKLSVPLSFGAILEKVGGQSHHSSWGFFDRVVNVTPMGGYGVVHVVHDERMWCMCMWCSVFLSSA